MKKLFASLVVILAILVTAPDAQAMTLQQQRNQVFLELRDIVIDVQTERSALFAQFQASSDPEERALLQSQILALTGRIRFLQSIRTQARFHYSSDQLNLLIVRFDLNVGPS